LTTALALDFGTGTTRLMDEGGELLVEEETLVALDADGRRLVAFGSEAVDLGRRAGGRVQLVRPVREGKIVDIDIAERFLAAVLRRAGAGRMSGARVLVLQHLSTTGVQRRAIERALRHGSARHVEFIDEPVAVAIGADLEISEPVGSMVVSVGAGLSDIAVLALGGIVAGASVEYGGERLDELVRDHLARQHRVVIDRVAARELRTRFGALDLVAEEVIALTGRDAHSGRPAEVQIDRRELCAVMLRATEPLLHAAQLAIAEAPPDLANDLSMSGLVLSGGLAPTSGLAERLAGATGIPVHLIADCELAALRGAARCIGEGTRARRELSSLRPR
jgi:rod shape-determining protein MreB and related proteins